MRIIFVGCVESSATLLNKLIDTGANVVGIITKNESKENADFCSLVPIAKSKGIDYLVTNDINDSITENFIKNKDVDVIYCFGWSRLIKKNILSIPRIGVIGNHPAELPYNRGRHPIIWALVLGLTETASSFFLMDEGADTGKLLAQEKILIDYNDDAESLYHKIDKVEEKLMIKITKELESGNLKYIEKDNKIGNVWRKRSYLDGLIDWRMSSFAIYNLVRALTHPYIGASFVYNDKEIKVWKVKEAGEEIKVDKNIEPGKILKVVSSNDFYVKVYDGVIHVVDSEPIELKEGQYL